MAFDLGAVQTAADRSLAANQPANILGAYQTMAQLQNTRLEAAVRMQQLQQQQLEFGLKQQEVQRTQHFIDTLEQLHTQGVPLEDADGFLSREAMGPLSAANPTLANTLAKSYADVVEARGKAAKEKYIVNAEGIFKIPESGKPTQVPPSLAPKSVQDAYVAAQSGTAAPTTVATPGAAPTAAPEGGGGAPTEPAPTPPSTGAPTSPTPPAPSPAATPSGVTPSGVTAPALPAPGPGAIPFQPQAAVPGGLQEVVRFLTPAQRDLEAKIQDYLGANNLPNTPANRVQAEKAILTYGKESEIAEQQARTAKTQAETEQIVGKIKQAGTPEGVQAAINSTAPVGTAQERALYGMTNQRYTNELKDLVARGIYTPQAGAEIIKRVEDETKTSTAAQQSVGPRVQVVTAGQTNPRLDKSYEFNARQVDTESKPVDDTIARVSRIRETIAQGNPTSTSLLAPELLSIMSGGQGSGLRMNQAEINNIVGGRSNWETLRAAAQKWSLDPEKANPLTPNQINDMNKLVDAVNAKLTQKQQILRKADEDLVNANDIERHRAIVARMRQDLATVDQAPPGQVSSGKPRVKFSDLPK